MDFLVLHLSLKKSWHFSRISGRYTVSRHVTDNSKELSLLYKYVEGRSQLI
jgi:hypothetical protein